MTTLAAPRPTLDYQTPTRPAAGARSIVTHWLAWAVLLTTLPLLSLGGLVTSTGAGLAVPDWPNSFGYNMFALPWGRWLGEGSFTSGVFQEHAHRLLGTVTGLAAITLCGWAWFRERNPIVWSLATLILLAVIVQGLMGGFRVTEQSRLLSFLHGVFGQVVFGLMAATVAYTGRWWRAAPRRVAAARRPAALGVMALLLVLTQLGLGAAMRHDAGRNHLTGSGPGLAVPDWPTSYGHVVPPVSASGVARANAARAEIDLPPTTVGDIWLHTAHRLGAYATLAVVLSLAFVAVRRRADLGGAWPLAAAAGGLVLLQATLGVLTVLYRKPADIATTHQAIGAILLAVTVAAVLKLWRLRGAA